MRDFLARPELFFLLIATIVLPFGNVGGGEPEDQARIHFSGVLRTPSGQARNGDFDMHFRFFEESTGGVELFDDFHSGVSVRGGTFAVVLGDGPPSKTLLGGIGSLGDLFRSYPFPWLQLEVDGEVLSPRIRVGASGYAVRADTVDGVDSSKFLRNDFDNPQYAGPLVAVTFDDVALEGWTMVGQAAVRGKSYSASGNGVSGESDGAQGRGLYGLASHTSGVNFGVFGETLSPSGYAGAFVGRVHVEGDTTLEGDVEVMGALRAETSSNQSIRGDNYVDDGEAVSGYAFGGRTSYGVFGQSSGATGYGVRGVATHTTGLNYGVSGYTWSSNGRGVFGLAGAVSGSTIGVVGQTNSPDGIAVFGSATAPGSGAAGWGVLGQSESSTGRGVYGLATAATGTTYGVYGESSSPDGYGGYFLGRVGLEEIKNLVQEIRIRANSQVRVIVDDDDSTTANHASWYHDGQVTSPFQLARLGEDGSFRIRGTLSENQSFDVAESFLITEPLEPGDVVSVTGDGNSVRRSASSHDAAVIGVVSTEPGVLLGSAPFDAGALADIWGERTRQDFLRELPQLQQAILEEVPEWKSRWQALSEAVFEPAEESGKAARDAELAALEDEIASAALHKYWNERTAPVALSGRVPVKVDASFGAIEVGDYLAPSSVAGVAMKATEPGPVIGTALEPLSAGSGKILVFVHRSHFAPGGPDLQARQTGPAGVETAGAATPRPTGDGQLVEGHLQVVLDGGSDDSARYSIFRDGEDGRPLSEEVFRIDEDGNVYARGAFRPSAMDLAEYFQLSRPAEPGDVLVVDPESPGRFRPSGSASDPAVVGVVSSQAGVLLGSGLARIAAADTDLAERLDLARRAGDTKEEAAIWARLEATFQQIHAPVALSGTVPCKVDAGYGAIRVGDLLTTSPTPGHAMRVDEIVPGAILGKALEALDSGTGTIKILVMLR